MLGEEVVKNIELTNPTNKPISYWVNLEDHPDYKLESDEAFTIEPKSTYKVFHKIIRYFKLIKTLKNSDFHNSESFNKIIGKNKIFVKSERFAINKDNIYK